MIIIIMWNNPDCTVKTLNRAQFNIFIIKHFLSKFIGFSSLYMKGNFTYQSHCALADIQKEALTFTCIGSIPLNFSQSESWIFLINLPGALALDRAFIFFTSFTLCISYSTVLWNEMATSKNLSPELMESGRKRKTSLLEMTLLIFNVSHLTGRGRVRSEEEWRVRASPGPQQMWRLLYLPGPIRRSCSKNKAPGLPFCSGEIGSCSIPVKFKWDTCLLAAWPHKWAPA